MAANHRRWGMMHRGQDSLVGSPSPMLAPASSGWKAAMGAQRARDCPCNTEAAIKLRWCLPQCLAPPSDRDEWAPHHCRLKTRQRKDCVWGPYYL